MVDDIYKVVVLDMQPIDPPVGGGRLRLLGLYHGLGEKLPTTYIGTYDWPGEKFRKHRLSKSLEEIDIPLSEEHFINCNEWQKQVNGKTIIDTVFFQLAHLSPQFVDCAQNQVIDADIVIFSHPWVYPLVKGRLRKRNQLVVYDSHNMEGILRTNLLDDGGFGTEIVKKAVMVEYELCHSADLILACSDEDRGLFHHIYGIPCAKIKIVPNGVFINRILFAEQDTKERKKKELGLDGRPLVIFLGSDYPPNIEATDFICKNLAPRLPHITFAICGGVGGRLNRDLGEGEKHTNIRITGLIDEEQKLSYLSAADLAINPMFSGSGTNIKMFDFMAAGLPIISTSVGARGIEGGSDNGLLVVPEEDIVSTISKVIEDPNLKTSMSKSARNLVEEKYSWERISKNLGFLLHRRYSKMDAKPFFTVIIPSYERQDCLSKLMKFLSAQRWQDFEVIVVDQSRGKWSGKDESYGFDFLYIHTEIKSTAKARNLGAFYARGEVLAFTDDDCEPRPEWLRNAFGYFSSHDVIGVEGLIRSDKLGDPDYRTVTNVGFEGIGFMTANLFVKSEIFNSINGFDEAFDTPFREDTDLAWRALEYGRIPYGRDVEVFHPPHPRDIARESSAERSRFFEKDALLLKKHPNKYLNLFLRENHWKNTQGFWDNFLRGAKKYNINIAEHDVMRYYKEIHADSKVRTDQKSKARENNLMNRRNPNAGKADYIQSEQVNQNSTRTYKIIMEGNSLSQLEGDSGRKSVLALIENTASAPKAIDLVRKAPEGATLTAVVRHGTFTEEELEAKTDSFYYYHLQMPIRSVFDLLKILRAQPFDSLIYAGIDKPQNRFLRLLAVFSGAKEKYFLDCNAEGRLEKLCDSPLVVIAGIAGSILIWVLLLPLVFMLRLFLKGSAAGRSGQKGPVKPESFRAEELRKVSVVIPNYNGKELLSECLPGIMKAIEYYPESEVIVVDDASTDDSVRLLREEFPSIKVITQEKNLGFGRTCETGIRAAMNRLVILLNSDVFAENDFVTPLAAHFSDPDVFAVQPKMFYWEKDRFNLGMNMGRMEDGYIRIWNEAEANNPVHVGTAAQNLYAIGGAMAFDKKKWDILSGFDPLFYPFTWEDIDISYRALKRGWRVIYEPRSIVFHKHHGTLAKVYNQSYRRIIEQKNEMLFIWKNIHDPEMILEHFRKLPKLLLMKQLSGDSTFAKAFFKAFKQIKGVLATRREELALSCITDREVLEPPLRYYRRFMRNSFQDVGLGRRQVLVMMPFMPYPPSDGGKIRAFMLLKQLSREFDIHLLTFIEREEEKKHIPELKKIFKGVDTVLRIPSPLSSRLKFLFPVYFRGFYSDAMRDKLIDILKTRPIDVVHIKSTQMSYYIEFIKQVPVLFTEFDAGIFSIGKSYNRPNKGLKRIADYVFFFQAHRWMKQYAKKFDKIIAVTDNDKKSLVSFLGEDGIEVVNTGVDIKYFSSGYEEIKENRLVFVGFMGHYPNVDAMLYFCSEIFPLIKAEVPDVKLTIVGSGNSNEINALRANAGIEVTGYVEDIRPYVRKGAVFLAPMRKGAGLKGKLLEAMAMCKPIVTTPIGCQGLPTVPGRDLLVAMKPEEFSQDVIRLLRDPTLRKKLALNAYEIVRRDFDWNRVSAKMAGIYHNVINGGGITGEPQEALPKWSWNRKM